MESLAINGLGGLGKDVLDLILSPAGRAALVVIGVALAMRAFRLRRRGKKPARNAAWLKARLAGEGFKKWVYLDVVIYLVLACATGLSAYVALGAANLALSPAGYDYLFRPDRDWIMVPALFLGIAIPGFLWLPVGRSIHGGRFRKYVLYMIAHYNADTRPLIKWGCTTIVVLCAIFSVQMSRVHFGLAGAGGDRVLIQQGVFALQPRQYAIREATAIFFVLKRRAPNGNVVDRPYIAVTFADGRAWTSAWWIGGPKAGGLVELARRISGYAGLAVVPRDFFGQDDLDKRDVSRS